MLAHKYESTETLSGHASSITVVLFSPDGEYLASGSENGIVLVTATESWDTVKKARERITRNRTSVGFHLSNDAGLRICQWGDTHSPYR